MLDKLKSGALHMWDDLVHGEHRWCMRLVLVGSALAGACVGHCLL